MKKSRLSFTKLFQESRDSEKEKRLATGIPDEQVGLLNDTGEPSFDSSETSDDLLCDGCWTAEMADTLYELASKFLADVFQKVRAQEHFSLEKGSDIVRKLIEVKAPNDPLFIKSIHYDEAADHVVSHSVNTAIYSIILAKALELPVERQIEIGMAGLLHDVGMGFVPEEIIYKREPLTVSEFEKIKERPNYAYKILQNFGSEYNYLAGTALQVNERIDGSGYPAGLKGNELDEYAQIIGLAAVYEALIHSRPQRERFLHFTAIKEIIRTAKNRFQRKHLKALLSFFSIFPISSYVRLNSGAVGKVVETYPQYPMRPKLQIVYDSQKRTVLTEQIVDLPENPLLHIVDSVSESSIRVG